MPAVPPVVLARPLLPSLLALQTFPPLRTILATVALGATALGCAELTAPAPRPVLAAMPRAAAAEASPPAGPVTSRAELGLSLPAATYVRLALLSTVPELLVREEGPGGRIVEELELTGGGIEPVRLSWITAQAGEHRWVVESRRPGNVGAPGAAPAPSVSVAIAVTVEDQRPVGPCDAQRLQAERAVLAADRELNGPRPDAAARAAAELEPAAAAAAAAGEREAVLAVRLARARAAARQQPAEGLRLFAGALDLARELDDRAAEAEVLQERADLLPAADKRASLAAALDIRRQLGDEVGQSYLLHLAAYDFKVHGDLEAAERTYLRALALQWRNDDLGTQVWTLGELGAVSGRLGDLDRARAFLGVALERARQAGNLEAQAFALREGARLDIDLGDLQEAYHEYVQAHDLVATIGSGTELAWAVEGVGASLMYLGETEKARQRYGEALREFTDQHDAKGQAWTLLDIGAAFEAEHDAARALEHFEKALGVIRDQRVPAMEGLALYDLGRAYRDLRRPRQAVAVLEKAVALAASESRLRQAQALVELGNADADAGDPSGAGQAFQRAVQLSGQAPVVEAAAQAGLARVERDRGDLSAARSAIARAIEITETLRAGVVRPDQRVAFLASRRSYYEFYVDLLMRLDRQAPGAGHDAEALQASEQARARGLLDLLARQQVDVRHGIPAELKQREAAAGERIARLQTRLWSEGQGLSEAETGRLGRELDQAEEEERELEAEIRRSQPAYAAIRSPQPLPLAEIQALLDEGTALLEYFVAEEGSYLFVVTRGGLAVHALPPRAAVQPLVASVVAALGSDSRLQARRYVEDAWRLYQILIQPAAGDLRGKLLVAPDGPLYALSFEALLTRSVPDPGAPLRGLPYLIRDRSVSYVPSAGVLAQLQAEHRAGGDPAAGAVRFVGFGDPGDSERTVAGALGRPRPLPAAREEVSRIAGLFPPGQAAVFLGADASEENVKTSVLVTNARHLHFASHGLLDESSPDRSGLRLAHTGPVEDGLLQVREVFNLELHADLVVLSACTTGLGKEVSGEGLIGMARAFLYAGAGSVLVSLWKVDDQSTADLMVAFYRYLQELGDTSEALRRAKLDAIDRSRYVHPYFWAPFVLVGLPRGAAAGG